MGARDNLIDLTFVSDVAEGIADVALADDPTRGAVLRTWKPVTIENVVRQAERVFGRPVPVNWDAREPRAREMRDDWVFGSSPSGWSADVSLDEGLHRTWKAFTLDPSR